MQDSIRLTAMQDPAARNSCRKHTRLVMGALYNWLTKRYPQCPLSSNRISSQ